MTTITASPQLSVSGNPLAGVFEIVEQLRSSSAVWSKYTKAVIPEEGVTVRPTQSSSFERATPIYEDGFEARRVVFQVVPPDDSDW
ncbi:hypothetical protein [Arthrobacter sp. TB 23]|uniref:hypothetical protein n=1 Tax=Arthrobacter sp. TB 23 TaxID=494419 RepID=UPI0003688387|nr:hypothetical protein [Arthrobacter sp. TB 23]